MEARRTAVEWPTIGVATAIYLGFGLLTRHHADLPWWLVAAAGGWLVAWHGSLQHEVVHGHPTPWPAANAALVLPSLWLWVPLGIYRTEHLAHHRTEHLTDPLEDPESTHVGRLDWARAGPVTRLLLWADRTLLGRLVVGPPRMVMRLWRSEGRRLRAGTLDVRAWALHAAGAGLVLWWVLVVCRIPAAEYLLLYVWPGLSLTLLRSFAEHRASRVPGERTAIVEAEPPLALLFLNNNLHAVHHEEPGLPWYRLPERWRARRDELLAANGGYRFRGYRSLLRRYALRPKDPPLHPFA